MQLTILNERHIRLDADGHEELAIDSEAFGPLQMLATSLALCTAAVLHEYAVTAQLTLEPFSIEVRWAYGGRPRRIEHFDVQLLLPPHVSPGRHAALLRATEYCTVHATLAHSTTIETTLEVEGAQQA